MRCEKARYEKICCSTTFGLEMNPRPNRITNINPLVEINLLTCCPPGCDFIIFFLSVRDLDMNFTRFTKLTRVFGEPSPRQPFVRRD